MAAGVATVKCKLEKKFKLEKKLIYLIESHMKLMGYHSSVTDLKALHFLLETLDSDAAEKIFRRNCWPALDRKQEAEFRKLCKNWLQNIADAEPEQMFPKYIGPALMNPKSREFLKLMLKLCRYVMSKVISRSSGGKGMAEFVAVTPDNYQIHCAALNISTSATLDEYNKVLMEMKMCSEAQQLADEMVSKYNELSGAIDCLRQEAIQLAKKSQTATDYYESQRKAREAGDASALKLLTMEEVAKRHETLAKVRSMISQIERLPSALVDEIWTSTWTADTSSLTTNLDIFNDAVSAIRMVNTNLQADHLSIGSFARRETEMCAQDAQQFMEDHEEINARLSEHVEGARAAMREMRDHGKLLRPELVICPPSPILHDIGDLEYSTFEAMDLDSIHHSPVPGKIPNVMGTMAKSKASSGTVKSTRVPSPLLNDPLMWEPHPDLQFELKTSGNKQCTLRKKIPETSPLPKYLRATSVATKSTSTPLVETLRTQLPIKMGSLSSRRDPRRGNAKNYVENLQKTRSESTLKPVGHLRPPGVLSREFDRCSAEGDKVVEEVLGTEDSWEELLSPVPCLKLLRTSVDNGISLRDKEFNNEATQLAKTLEFLDSPFKTDTRARRSRSAEPARSTGRSSPMGSGGGTDQHLERLATTSANLIPISWSLSDMRLPSEQEDGNEFLDTDGIYCESDSVLLPSSPY